VQVVVSPPSTPFVPLEQAMINNIAVTAAGKRYSQLDFKAFGKCFILPSLAIKLFSKKMRRTSAADRNDE
jgi:hypothetical protein